MTLDPTGLKMATIVQDAIFSTLEGELMVTITALPTAIRALSDFDARVEVCRTQARALANALTKAFTLSDRVNPENCAQAAARLATSLIELRRP